ncbi:MAG TPA: BON domain-containing protein [Balneolaceae bacterium]|nr:BON domain-containing protein [Balneolaceae bacterium]
MIYFRLFQEHIKCRILLFAFIPLLLLAACEDNSHPEAENLPTDEEIARALQTQFAAAEEVHADNLQIAVENGIVRLKGSTTNLLAKQRASQIAEATAGVISVINTLKITADRPDEAIHEDVAEALSTNPATEGWEINSEVNNGVVTLKGAVDSWQEKQLATAIASRVKGVKGVDNIILVANDEDRKDPDIKAEIESILEFDARIGDERIDVEVANGIVMLGGSVGSAAEKRMAIEAAHIAGVEKVVADNLKVDPELNSQLYGNKMISSLTPEQIEKAIIRAFIYDPRVPAEEINVAIEEGVAVLSGSVKNLNAKMAAEADTRKTVGVNSIVNDITVKREVVVKPEVPTTDEAIKSRIKNAIHRDPYVEEAVITVHVKEGTVELIGTVNSRFEKEHIEEIVTRIKGIVSIDNQLKVKDEGNATS